MRPTLTFETPTKQTAITAAVRRRDRPALAKGRRLPDSTTSRISLTLDSSLDSVDKVERTAEEFAARAGFDEDTVPNIVMAVREAAVNAVLHGNAYDPAKRVAASFETTADALIVRIADQGLGLDPDALPDPLAPENILRGSGRGIFLIRAFMDEVHFRKLHPGTELTLIKYRAPVAQA
jgi:serine/threonine-protein kinase RsbW